MYQVAKKLANILGLLKNYHISYFKYFPCQMMARVDTIQSVLPCDNSLPLGINNLDTLAIELEVRQCKSSSIILYDEEEPSGGDKRQLSLIKRKL